MKYKKAVIFSAVILLYAAVFAGLIFMRQTGRHFVVFGRVVREFSSLCFLFVIAFLVTVGWVLREKNLPKVIVAILSCAAVLFGLFCVVYDTEFHHNKRITVERLTLSDGKRVLLDEVCYGDDDSAAEVYVYKLSGCIAKEAGNFFEWFGVGFHGIEQGCWEYTYDETDKKLTITIEYDELNPYIKKEYDTGFWKEEFILE